MPETKTRYRDDFVVWSKEQAEALRAASHAGSNLALDWENLAEEVESLGTSERRELHSQIQRVIQHLLKLQHSMAIDPRRGWEESIGDARSEIELLLETSPSLAGEVQTAIVAEFNRGSRKAIRDLEKHGEIAPAVMASIRATAYTAEQILGDWFPPEPPG